MLPDKEPLQSANDGGQALLLFEVASDESSTCWYLYASKVRDKVRQFPKPCIYSVRILLWCYIADQPGVLLLPMKADSAARSRP